MYTVNKKLAVTPFAETDTKTEVVNGRVVIKQRSELTALKVVFDTDCDETMSLDPGDTVYVRGDLCKSPQAKEIFEMDGKRFILIDASSVIGVEYDVG